MKNNVCMSIMDSPASSVFDKPQLIRNLIAEVKSVPALEVVYYFMQSSAGTRKEKIENMPGEQLTKTVMDTFESAEKNAEEIDIDFVYHFLASMYVDQVKKELAQ